MDGCLFFIQNRQLNSAMLLKSKLEILSAQPLPRLPSRITRLKRRLYSAVWLLYNDPTFDLSTKKHNTRCRPHTQHKTTFSPLLQNTLINEEDPMSTAGFDIEALRTIRKLPIIEARNGNSFKTRRLTERVHDFQHSFTNKRRTYARIQKKIKKISPSYD